MFLLHADRVKIKNMDIVFKWANPGVFLVYFRSFQTKNTIFTTNQCEKMSKSPSSIRRKDSNPQTFDMSPHP